MRPGTRMPGSASAGSSQRTSSRRRSTRVQSRGAFAGAFGDVATVDPLAAASRTGTGARQLLHDPGVVLQAGEVVRPRLLLLVRGQLLLDLVLHLVDRLALELRVLVLVEILLDIGLRHL